jgi:nucleotide-binding universal stress UspA family protein
MAAKDTIREFMTRLGVKDTREPVMLRHGTLSSRGAAAALAQYAARSGAGLVVAASHGRSGMKRLILGSFAEALLQNSPVPVLIVGQRRRHFQEHERILFPTDFGPDFPELFRRTRDLAVSLGARVTLFHSIEHPLEPAYFPAVSSVGGAWTALPEYLDRETAKVRQRAAECVWLASDRGVTLDYVIDQSGRPVAEAILRMARRKKAGFIAMATQAGPVGTLVMGSVARKVARNSPCPVWVMRAGQKVSAVKPVPARRAPAKKAA